MCGSAGVRPHGRAYECTPFTLYALYVLRTWATRGRADGFVCHLPLPLLPPLPILYNDENQTRQLIWMVLA
ncbi:hypothetical protein EON67_07500, partial [archaeon]